MAAGSRAGFPVRALKSKSNTLHFNWAKSSKKLPIQKRLWLAWAEQLASMKHEELVDKPLAAVKLTEEVPHCACHFQTKIYGIYGLKWCEAACQSPGWASTLLVCGQPAAEVVHSKWILEQLAGIKAIKPIRHFVDVAFELWPCLEFLAFPKAVIIFWAAKSPSKPHLDSSTLVVLSRFQRTWCDKTVARTTHRQNMLLLALRTNWLYNCNWLIILIGCVYI